MNIKKHLEALYNNLNIAYGLHKILFNEKGEPEDFIIMDANDKYFEFTGFDPESTLMKKISDLLPDIKKLDYDWLSDYSRIALNGGEEEFERYSAMLDKRYRIKLYSPEKNYFVALFELLPSIDKEKTKEISSEKNEFRKISQVSLNLSRIDTKEELFSYIRDLFAKEFPQYLIMINDYLQQENVFVLKSISGIDENKQKEVEDLLGFDPRNKSFPLNEEFKYIYIQKSLYKYQNALEKFASPFINRKLTNQIFELTNTRNIYTIGLKTSNKLMGSINFFCSDSQLQNYKNYIESLSFQISANLEKINIQEKLIIENELFRKGNIVIFKWQNRDEWPVDYVSPNVKNLLGFDESDFYSGKIVYADLIHKNDLEKVNKEVQYGFSSNENVIEHAPYRIRTKEGSYIWVHDFTILSRDKNNHTEFMLGYIYDVTKNKENEIKLSESLAEMKHANEEIEAALNKLEESENRLKFALEGSKSGVWDWNLETNEVFFSKQWKKMIGFEDHEITGSLKEWEKRVHPDDLEQTYKKIQDHLEGITEIYTSEHRVLCKDNTYKWILDKGMVIKWDENGKPLRMIGTHLDLTERIKAEERLKLEKEKLQRILKTSLDGFFIVDLQGNFKDANDSYCKMIGYDYQELMKMKIPDVEAIESIEETREHIEKIMETGSDRFVTKHRSKQGNEIDIEVSVNLLKSDGQKMIVTFCRDITEQIKSEMALKESRKQLESFFSQSLDGFFFMMIDQPVDWNDSSDKEKLLDYVFSNQKMTKANDAILKQYGLSHDEFIGLTPRDFFSHDIERGKEIWRDFFDNGKMHLETKERIFDGSDMWIEGDYVCLYDDDGRIRGHFGIQRDVTDQKIAEQKLIEEEEKFRQLTEHIEEVFWLRNAENDKMIYVSPAYENIWGRSCESLYDNPDSFFESIHQEDKESVIRDFQSNRNIIDGYFDMEYRITRPDGKIRWIWARAFPVKDKNGKMIRRAGIAEDITNRKEMEQRLKDSEERYRGLIESQTDLIVRVDEKNRFTYVNDTYCNTFGKKREELIGKVFTPLIHEDDIEDTLQAMESLGKPPYRATIEQRAKTIDGWRWFEWEDNAILDDKGNIVEIQGVGRDITELKEAENKALQASRAKSEFLANMSHEIRTPMNSILGFSEILLNTVEDPLQKDYLSTILSSGKTLLSLINDILDLSKIEAGKLDIVPKSVDISQTINEIAGIFSQKVMEKGLELKININDDFPKIIRIDEVRLRQVLLNLIGNAVKFTDNGEVNIITRTLKKNEDKVDFAIEVHDTGIGINQKLGNEIFEAFTQQMQYDTKKYGGTGLGLAISKRLTKMMNGDLYYESEEGRGSIFTVVFKDCKVSESVMKYDDPFVWDGKDIVFSEAKLLVVDDVDYNRDLVRNFLIKSNIDIYEADNGSSALELIQKDKPDAILMDIRMPVMDGIKATEMLKNDPETKDIPIIAFTASILKREEDLISDLFDDILRKPIMKKGLIKILTKYLEYSVKKEYKKSMDIYDRIETQIRELPDEEKKKLKEEHHKKYKEKLNQLILLMDLEEIREFWGEFKSICNDKNIPSSDEFCDHMILKIDNFDYNEVEKILKFIKELFENL